MRIRVALFAAALAVAVASVLWLGLGDSSRPAPQVMRPAMTVDNDTTPGAALQLRIPFPSEDDGLQTASRLGARRVSDPETADAGGADASTLEAKIDGLLTDAVQAWLRLNAAAAEKYVDRYCAEAKHVASPLAPAPHPRTRDAAPFMAGRSDWEGDPGWRGGRIGLLHLPASLTTRMGEPPLSWRRFTPADYAGLDFGWMRELLEYDSWSLTAAGPLKDVEVLGPESPLPNYITLQHWVKLRLVKGRHEGSLAQASLEVRHLGDLIASSGTLVGEMIRAGFFGIERGVWEDAGLTPPEPLPTAGDIQGFRHAAFAGMYFLYPGVLRSVREKALKCIPTRCAALNEAIAAAAAMRHVAQGAQEQLDWLQAQEPCDPKLAERMARGPADAAGKLMDTFTANPGVEYHMAFLLDGGAAP